MELILEVSEKNEGTAEPWWTIIDPRQNFETKREQGIYNIAGMVTGPFFSRESAQNFLERTRYNFSKNARVFCHSGYYSQEYKTACRNAKKKKETPKWQSDQGLKERSCCCLN